MSELKTTTSDSWSSGQAITLAAFSLLLGTCGGWLIRRSLAPPANANPIVSATAPGAPPAAPMPTNFSSIPAAPSAAELKHAADNQAAPLLTQLNGDPTNAELLAQVGNLYYDAKLYATAIEYYERSLKAQPDNASVRTDMGTAYWYQGDPDTAIAQFNKSAGARTDEGRHPFQSWYCRVARKKGRRGSSGSMAEVAGCQSGLCE